MQLLRVWFSSDLIHCEADGLHVHALLPELPSVLLHQGDHHAAHVIVVVSVLQPQLELRVGPERVCRAETQTETFTGQNNL